MPTMLIDVVRQAVAAQAEETPTPAEDPPSLVVRNGISALRDLLLSSENAAENTQQNSQKNLKKNRRSGKKNHKQENPEKPTVTTSASSLAAKLTPWNRPTAKEEEFADALSKFLKTLNKNPNPSPEDAQKFLKKLVPHLKEIVTKLEIQKPNNDSDPIALLRSCCQFLGMRVVSALVRRCAHAHIWEAVEILLPLGSVCWNSCGDLIPLLVECQRGDLLCECLRSVSEIRPTDLLLILKYFLFPGHDETLSTVKNEWKKDALAAISCAAAAAIEKNRSIYPRDQGNTCLISAEEHTAILHAMAYDGFSSRETCLHFLVSSLADDAIMSFIIHQLDSNEVLELLRYLKKWVIKYMKRVMPGPPPVLSVPTIKYSRWIPSLVAVVQWIGEVIDEHFSTMILCPEFHHELKELRTVTCSCSSILSESSTLVAMLDAPKLNINIQEVNNTGDGGIIEYWDM